MRPITAVGILVFLAVASFCHLAQAQWIKSVVNTTEALRGLSVVNEKVIWASGTGGTVINTVDGGKTWNVEKVPGAEKLDFRDIEAFDAKTAYILSIGNGSSSRIYKTIDGGSTWQLQFTNSNEKAFFDAIACFDRNNCVAVSDPVDGHYPLIETSNGGKTWSPLVSNQMPAAKDGEAAFAASGTCLIAYGRSNLFLVSGGSDARVFRSADRGKTWTVSNTPIKSGTAGSGIFSIAMFNSSNGVVVGGNYEKPVEKDRNLAFTSDGGATWTSGRGISGYRSAVTYVFRQMIVAVGTNGSDITLNGGVNWAVLDRNNYNSVQAKGRGAVWAVGPKGMVARLATFADAHPKLPSVR